jgi:hypothetical protein
MEGEHVNEEIIEALSNPYTSRAAFMEACKLATPEELMPAQRVTC